MHFLCVINEIIHLNYFDKYNTITYLNWINLQLQFGMGVLKCRIWFPKTRRKMATSNMAAISYRMSASSKVRSVWWQGLWGKGMGGISSDNRTLYEKCSITLHRTLLWGIQRWIRYLKVDKVFKGGSSVIAGSYAGMVWKVFEGG